MIPLESGTGLKCLRFYENWWLMAEGRDTDEKRLAFYDAIMRYAFLGEVPSAPKKGISHASEWAAWDGFLACKPMIDKVPEEIELHEKRVKAGYLGGVASGLIRAKENDEAKVEANIEANIEAKVEAKVEAPDEANPSNPLIIRNINKKDNKKDNIKTIMGCGASKEDIGIFFDAWWKAYPGFRKQDKKRCREKFSRILESSKDAVKMFNTMMESLENVWKKCDIWTKDDGQYIKGPLVWLNNENWNDTPGEAVTKTPSVANIHHSKTAEVQDVF